MSAIRIKGLRAAWPFLLLLIAAATIVSFSLRRDENQPANGSSAGAATPVYVAERATWIRFGTDGLPQLQAEAQRIDYFADRSMQLDTVTLDRLGGDQGAWHLEAPRGEVPAGSSKMRLSPDVAVKGTSKTQLPVQIAASEVWVDWEKREISSEQPVSLQAPGRNLSADQWQTDFNGSRSQLRGHVEVEYDAPQKR